MAMENFFGVLETAGKEEDLSGLIREVSAPREAEKKKQPRKNQGLPARNKKACDPSKVRANDPYSALASPPSNNGYNGESYVGNMNGGRGYGYYNSQRYNGESYYQGNSNRRRWYSKSEINSHRDSLVEFPNGEQKTAVGGIQVAQEPIDSAEDNKKSEEVTEGNAASEADSNKGEEQKKKKMEYVRTFTLAQHEEYRLKKRMTFLEAMKVSERVVTPDKEFESMRIVNKKEEEKPVEKSAKRDHVKNKKTQSTDLFQEIFKVEKYVPVRYAAGLVLNNASDNQVQSEGSNASQLLNNVGPERKQREGLNPSQVLNNVRPDQSHSGGYNAGQKYNNERPDQRQMGGYNASQVNNNVRPDQRQKGGYNAGQGPNNVRPDHRGCYSAPEVNNNLRPEQMQRGGYDARQVNNNLRLDQRQRGGYHGRQVYDNVRPDQRQSGGYSSGNNLRPYQNQSDVKPHSEGGENNGKMKADDSHERAPPEFEDLAKHFPALGSNIIQHW